MSDALFIIIFVLIVFGISGFSASMKEVYKDEQKEKRRKKRYEHSSLEYLRSKYGQDEDDAKEKNEEKDNKKAE